MIRRTAAEQILGEWGVRDATPDERRVRDALTEELDGHPLRGKPLRRRYRNFTPDAAGYVASLGGPLPYMQRLKEIEELTERHRARLEETWRALAAESRDAATFVRRWRAAVAGWSFYEVNDLIARHNRWFPIESRLPMDPRTGDFVRIDGKP
ncbi:MAG TPA: hypothetical protein VFL66_13610 [Gaiellaceae bacterium]|nr:hypothetical protein [Gaiellaceae bacterium]